MTCADIFLLKHSSELPLNIVSSSVQANSLNKIQQNPTPIILNMTAPKPSTGNAGSRAMEEIMTASSSTEWQTFLLKTMQAISSPLASNMLTKIGLNAATTEPFTLLDHGCGMGVVAPVLMETVPREVLEHSTVLCADLSEKLVDSVQERIGREGWVGCEARVVDAQVSGPKGGICGRKEKQLLVGDVY